MARDLKRREPLPARFLTAEGARHGIALEQPVRSQPAHSVSVDLPRLSELNQVVIAHELLHTLSATDKCEPTTNLPRFAEGCAEPRAVPLLPQARAELMAGRIPIGANRAEIPRSLRDVVIGDATAREIGWPAEPAKPMLQPPAAALRSDF